jgi:hypothetical protein
VGQGKQAIPQAERSKFPGGSGRFTGNRWDGEGRDGARAATLVPCGIATMGLEPEVLMDLAEAAASTGAWERDALVRWIRPPECVQPSWRYQNVFVMIPEFLMLCA